MQVNQTTKIARQVFDEEEGKWLTVTPDLHDDARLVRESVGFAKHIVAAAIRLAFDRKVYLAEGYSSKTEYCADVLGMSRRAANRLYQVAEMFDLDLKGIIASGKTESPKLLKNGGTSMSHPEDEQADPLDKIQQLGITKLQMLTQLSDEDREHFKRTGELPAEDGNVYTPEDLEVMSTRQLSQLVSSRTKQIREKLHEEEEKRQLAEAERDHLKSELEEAQQKLRDAEALRAEFQPQHSLIEDKRHRLAEAAEQLARFRDTLSRLGITADDPESLCHDLVDLLSKLEAIHIRAGRHYHDVRARIADLLT